MRWLWPVAAGVLIGLSGLTMSTAKAEPTIQPGPTTTSSSDELADMVLDVVEGDDVAAPTTTPVPAPPR